MSVVRIYADFMGFVPGPKNPARTAIVLDTFGSLQDLANAGIVLKEGLPLIGVDYSDETEDLEGHGTAEYDHDNNWWVIELDELGVRNVPARERIVVREFKCVSCRFGLRDLIDSRGLTKGDICPGCGTPIHAPIARPVDRLTT